MKASDIHDWVRDNLIDLLGQYIYPNGFSKPAIAIGNPPNDIKVTGSLEVVIPLFPRTKSNMMSNSYHREDVWDVFLIQRDRSGVLVTAVERMMTSFINVKGQPFPMTSEGENFEGYRISIIHRDVYQAFRGIN